MAGVACSVHRRCTAGCVDCRRLNAAYDRRRRALIASGQWLPPVPVAVVRAQLDALVGAGMSYAAISRAAGVAKRTVQGITSGRRRQVNGPTAAALLAVQPAGPALPAGQVDALPSVRRVRALLALGWPLTRQATQLGWRIQPVWEIAHHRQKAVTVATDRAIRGLYERLSATPGGSRRAFNDAARRGWVPPLAWDDIDDPAEVPDVGGDGRVVVDEVAIERALDGDRVRLTRAEKHHAIHVAVRRGLPPSTAGRVLGVSGAAARRFASTPLPEEVAA